MNSGTENLNISHRPISVVPPKDTTEIQLRLIDWRRIYRNVRRISPGVSKGELFAGVFWGITGSALLSLVPLYQAAQAVDAWVKPTFWLVAIFSLFVGILFFCRAKDRAANVVEVRDEIVTDMTETHRLYFPDENLDNS